MNKRILFIYGTRPEAIKMAPLVLELRKPERGFSVEICLTGQHREMLDQVNAFFGITGDYDLALMKPNQTLSDLTARCLSGLDPVLTTSKPDLIFVQGDTTTVLAGALAGYYRKVPVAHLEAGLRSGDKYSPYPEEMNRKIASQIAGIHFAPTQGAADNLKTEGIEKNVYVVGNTGIDALKLGMELLVSHSDSEMERQFPGVDFGKKVILVTGHRRESFGEGFENICIAIKELACSFSDIEVIYPVHLNPNVREPAKRILGNQARIHLVEPLDYPILIWLMSRSYFVLTDSGGIQEEAPSLGKPVLVMRDITERMEGVAAGTARLVGTKKDSILSGATELLTNQKAYLDMSRATNPYGDGKTSERIAEILATQFFS